ncbi:heparinase II/III domain-containing protein [Vibrio jasicida]|uniref:heparinase II/III domain-containing protein n=1 Tax=Vibrio jasicida TaxID=766224 RepID=UPI000CE4CEE2|nr:heparinase II/III family protein [Vibrio jasicida]
MLSLTRKHDFQLFTSPTKHSAVVNPPSFNWPHERYEALYSIELEALGGKQSWHWEHVQSPMQLDFSLESGSYRWRVKCEQSGELSLWNEFSIDAETEAYLAPTAKELFALCDGYDQFLLYFDEDISAVKNASSELRPKFVASVEGIDIEAIQYPNHYRRGLEEGKRTAIANVRNWIDRDLMALTLLYRVWGDETAGHQACQLLLRLAEWSPEGPASLLRPCTWGDEVGLSLARNLYLAYHWLSPLLTAEECDFVRPLLVRLAFQMEERLEQDQFKQFPGHSHTSRLPAYLGIAALALHKEFDVTTCERWLNYALMVYRGVLPFYGGADGSWVEGPFYSSSYTKWHHPFFLAVERLSGFSFYNHPFYKNYVKFAVDFVATQERIHPFGDGFWCQREGKEWPGFFAQNPLRIYAQRFGDQTARHLDRVLESDIESYKLHLLDVVPTIPQLKHREMTSCVIESSSDLNHIYYSYAGLGKLSKSKMALYYRASQFGNSSHRHADQGNFAFVDHGQNILTPSGSYGYRFGSQHHSLWTRTTQAHNLPLIAGGGQKLDCPSGVAHLIKQKNGPGFSYVVLDLTEAYTGCKHYWRTLVQCADKGIVVFDDIELTEVKEIQWRLHTPSQVEFGTDSIHLLQENLEYKLTLTGEALSSPQLVPEINDADGFYGDVESDAQKQIQHLEWQLPARLTHRVVMSCAKESELCCRLDDEGAIVQWDDSFLRLGTKEHILQPQ